MEVTKYEEEHGEYNESRSNKERFDAVGDSKCSSEGRERNRDCSSEFSRGSHGRCAKSPNDPKLSDCPARRDGCAGEGGGAAGVTRGAVRSSAWLNEAASRD